jgi:methylenetetrahydrofolate reductase (NADPH)
VWPTATRIARILALASHLGLLTRMFRPGAYQPDDLVEGLSPYLTNSDYRIDGFHIYTFNYVEHAEAWRRAILTEQH